jgi:hypothetical protein
MCIASGFSSMTHVSAPPLDAFSSCYAPLIFDRSDPSSARARANTDAAIAATRKFIIGTFITNLSPVLIIWAPVKPLRPRGGPSNVGQLTRYGRTSRRMGTSTAPLIEQYLRSFSYPVKTVDEPGRRTFAPVAVVIVDTAIRPAANIPKTTVLTVLRRGPRGRKVAESEL